MDPLYILLGVITCLIYYLTAESFYLFRSWRSTSLYQELQKVLTVWIIVVLVLTLLGFLIKISSHYSRLVIGYWFVLVLVCLVGCRIILRFTLHSLRAKGRNSRTVAVAGAGDLGIRVAKTIDQNAWLGFQLIGFYDDKKTSGQIVLDQLMTNGSLQVLGDLDLMVEKAWQGQIDVIYIVLPMRSEARIKDIVHRLAECTANVHIVPDLFTTELLNAKWLELAGIPMVSVFESPFSGLLSELKRLEDFLLGALITLCLSPFMIFIALGIKLTSKGPIIFRQHRYGLDGREVVIWKFRTMTCCEDGETINQARKDDQRITRFGSFLRRTSLDELPQFINVLQGKMSLVGPRPHAVAHNEQYRKLIHAYMLRHKVKPDITGLAQINGYRGETEVLEKMEDRVKYDLEYIRNWSILLDLKILFLTVFKGAWRINAY